MIMGGWMNGCGQLRAHASAKGILAMPFKQHLRGLALLKAPQNIAREAYRDFAMQKPAAS